VFLLKAPRLLDRRIKNSLILCIGMSLRQKRNPFLSSQALAVRDMLNISIILNRVKKLSAVRRIVGKNIKIKKTAANKNIGMFLKNNDTGGVLPE